MTDQASDVLQSFAQLDDISDLPRDEWAEMIEELAEELGYYQPLGADHGVAFVDDGPRLLVCFDEYERVTERTKRGYPHGMELAAQNGWSVLSLIAHGNTPGTPWFRSKEVIGYFDRLVDDGFFEDFDQVVFYGAGAAGYAAAAFSVVAPGSTAVLIAPQASLDGRLASWDKRFPETRRMDFTTRYGFAPNMIDAADRAFVLYDPRVEADAMHAALFHQKHVDRMPLRLFGADPEFEMMEMDALDPILGAAMQGQLTRQVVSKALRNRRTHMGYMRRLLNEASAEQRPFLLACLCRHVIRLPKNAPRFNRAYKRALEVMQENGRIPAFADLDPKKNVENA